MNSIINILKNTVKSRNQWACGFAFVFYSLCLYDVFFNGIAVVQTGDGHAIV
jgi:hypothetical protein